MAIKDDILEALGDVRELITAEVLPDIGKLLQTPIIDDNAGGETTGAPQVIAVFSCMLEPMGGGAEQVIAARIGAARARKVTLPVGIDLAEDLDFQVNGVAYEIVEFAEDDTASYAALQVVYVKQLT